MGVLNIEYRTFVVRVKQLNIYISFRDHHTAGLFLFMLYNPHKCTNTTPNTKAEQKIQNKYILITD